MQDRDRDLFRLRIAGFRKKGEANLLSTGVVIDGALAEELARRGSDVRHGVNLICSPTSEIVEQIVAIQNQLSEFEPNQYCYPPEDLHLTLVELCHSRSEEEANTLALKAQTLAPPFLAQQRPAIVSDPLISYDAGGVAVNFLPADERLQSLRAALGEHLASHGVSAGSRYAPQSAHITFFRYVSPLRTPASRWVEILNRCRVEISAGWSLNPVWLTWGPTWYGIRNRISRFGPIPVGSQLSDQIESTVARTRRSAALKIR